MSQEVSKRYAQRGVSASKEDVHNAIKHIDKGLFPKAFCKVVPDYLTNDPEYCIVMYADGAGTKVLWPICIGKRLEIYQFGRIVRKTFDNEY